MITKEYVRFKKNYFKNNEMILKYDSIFVLTLANNCEKSKFLVLNLKISYVNVDILCSIFKFSYLKGKCSKFLFKSQSFIVHIS